MTPMAWLLKRVFGRTSAVLNAQNLSSELATVVDWFGLGLNLGLPKHELDRIERDYQGNDRRRVVVLDLWLQCTPNATWEDVVRALEQMGEKRVAENILQIRGESDLRRALVLELECHTVKAKRTGRELGSGTYGRVIELKSGSKILAGKIFNIPSCILPQTVISKLRKEVALMAKVHHPNIVHFEGVCFLDNITMPVLLMERLMSSLHDYLLKPTNPNITLILKLSILCDVARGLVYLHSCTPAIIHRDLTGNNVLLDSALRAKIADFGNAQIMDLNPEATPKIFTSLPGTLDYMPPEAESSSARYDPSLDVFSFGHLSLFTIIKSPVHPLLPPTYTDAKGLLHARSEVMRRAKYLEKAKNLLGEQYSLVLLIKECLHNQPAQRPRTAELETRLQDISSREANVSASSSSQATAFPSEHLRMQVTQGGGKTLTGQDLFILTEILRPAAPQWKTVGLALGFLDYELATIEQKPLLIPEGPPGYFREILSQWLKWAPPNHSLPTLESLAPALRSSGHEDLAVKLRTAFLQKKGAIAPPVTGPFLLQPPSTPAPLDIHVDPPMITQDPESQSVSTGAEEATFKIEATGDELTFQWQKNGSDLHSGSSYSGINTNTLKIQQVKKSDAGHYRCLVKNRVVRDGKLSKEAELTVFDPPMITQDPESQSVSTGAEEATFKIEATGDELTFQWQKNGSDLHSGSSYSGINTNTLKIQVKKSDAGHYRCLVKNRVVRDGKLSKEAKLSVFDPPMVTQDPENQSVSTGAEEATFKIEATGDELTFQWQKNGSDLHSGSSYSGINTNTLKIQQVKKSDAGHYRCLVKNRVVRDGELSKEAELTVFDPPMVTQDPENQSVSTGAEAIPFKIEATGDDLIFQWQKNGSDLHSGSNYSGIITNTLKIRQVKKSDAGHYRCLVRNRVVRDGKFSKEAKLSVFDPPMVTQDPENQSVSTGAEAVAFKIEATGDELTFQWQKNGSDLHSGSNYSGINTNTLMIRQVKKSDAGHYRCLVKNRVVRDGELSKEAELTVFDPPMITQDPESQSVSTGAEAVTFKIETTGDELTFQWQKNGSDLHGGSNYSGINTNTLMIRQVKKSDAGHYRCLVKNQVVMDGKLSKEAELTVVDFHRTTPEPVMQLRACMVWLCCFCCYPCTHMSRRQAFSSIESSEDSQPEDQFSLPLESIDTPDLVPKKMTGGVELQSLDEMPSEFIPSSAIPVQKFLEHVEKFDASRQLLFQQEFEWISNNSPWHSSDASNDPLNDDKNRYSNITAFDHSRVRLTPIEGVECSDYINANYVTGYRDAQEYIATQGPLDETVDDFWRMVWEQNSATIVMLTNLVELGKAKCAEYWPSDSLSIHGTIRVKLEHSVVLPDYTIRNLTVESLRTGERRTVLQFHYTKWPEYGTPKLAAPLLNFLKAIRKSNPDNVGPITFHCSAGVGRTGTVMAIDFCLQQIKKEKVGNVRGFVSKMRDQRNYMVQTEQQYTFIHYALLEAIAYGNTSFPLSDFPTSYEQLKEVNKETGKSLLEEEFDRLTTVRTMVLKSSFVQRVKLKGDHRRNILLCGMSDFRAHYVDSYLEPQLMVVCDGPTEDTTAKFWQMVWDERCTYLIMLNPQDGDYHCYWPNFGSLRQYGNLIVEVEEESAEYVYTTRKILLTDSKVDGVTHRVQQYQFIGWATQFFPSVPTFVDFLCDVLKKTDSLQKKQRLLIHDTKSLGPSGIFCSLYYCVERLRLERVVDVFQAVQKMQLQRPGMVESVQQYAFIYDCMFEFIRTHSDPQ